MTLAFAVRLSSPRAAPFLLGRRTPKPKGGLRIADEDGARRALGAEGLPSAFAPTAAGIEHLARIALG